jgi:alpha-D-xyloside xylohydrolase
MRPGGVLREFSEDWTPIFADPSREYAYLVEMVSHGEIEGGAEFEARADGGELVKVRVVFVTAEVVRIQAWLSEEPPRDSLMLVEGDRLKPVPPRVIEDEEGVTLDGDVLQVRVARRPWSVTISESRGRTLFQLKREDTQLSGAVVLPTGYSRDGEGPVAFHEVFSLEPGERLYGLGGQFGSFDHRGQRIVSWSRDPSAAMTSTVSYLNVPFFMSSRGYGVFVHHASKIAYELGEPSVQTAAFRVTDPYLDYFLVYGPSPKEMLSRYGELTGRPAVPPLWSFGAWFSRCMYRTRAEVEEIAARLRELGVPADVMHVDPLWLTGRLTHPWDGCDFVWNEEAFPDPEGFVRWLDERGFKLSLWENPYVWTDTDMYREGEERGYLVRSNDGGVARSLDYDGAAPVDFTNPEAVRWWQEKHRPYLRMGVAAFKTDYGEAVPPDAVFADGRSGKQVHNIYPVLFNRAVFEVVREERGEAIVFGRSGYAGSQRYPINWTGDTPSTWGGMAAALRAGLSMSLSGISMWSHDIGGFLRPPYAHAPDATLYIRWAQWGLLSSHSRFHGIHGREPWHFGEKAVEVVREFARQRYRLLPYIYSLAREAVESGMPVVRPLLLEYPEDPVAATADFEYLLGPYLLVTPVMNEEGRCLVYLPEGEWFDWWAGEAYRGPKHIRLEVPIERLPLYVRNDSILAMAPEMEYTGQREWEPLTLEVRVASLTEAKVWSPQEEIRVKATREDGRIELSVDGAEQTLATRRQGYEVRFVEPHAVVGVEVEGDGTLESVEAADGTTVVRVSACGSWVLRGMVGGYA